MRKKLLLPMLLLMTAFFQLAIAQEQGKTYKVSGIVDGETDKRVRLEPIANEGSGRFCEIKDGKFHFEGKIDHPTGFRLKLEKPDQKNFYEEEFMHLYIEPASTVVITLNVQNVSLSKVEGSNTDKEYRKLLIDRDSIKFGPTRKRILKEYEIASNNKDSLRVKALSAEFKKMIEEVKEWNVTYIMQYPKSYVSAYQLYFMQQAEELLPVELSETFGKLDPSLSNLNVVQIVKKSLNNQIGQRVTDFTLPDMADKQVTLSEITKGKVTFIDFWWSGCAPCRIENPHLERVYQDYKAKGFEMVGITSDTDRNKWIDAVKKDGITFTNLIDHKRKVKEAFYVAVWPWNFLVDSNGIVIAKNISAEELRLRLEAMLK